MNINNIKVNNNKQKGEFFNKLEDYADVVSIMMKIVIFKFTLSLQDS
jgi:hypothetical protein